MVRVVEVLEHDFAKRMFWNWKGAAVVASNVVQGVSSNGHINMLKEETCFCSDEGLPDVGQRVHFPHHAVHAPLRDVRHLVSRWCSECL